MCDIKYGGLAQSERAPRLHRGGRRFESCILHHLWSVSEAVITPSCHGGISGSIPLQTAKNGGTKPVKNYKLEQSKRFTIAPAYNKGGYQVISREDIKHIGK